MPNSYQPPTIQPDMVFVDENNSGGGRSITLPPGIKGWSWGAFLLNWIWAIFNKTWLGLICLVPYVGIVFGIYLGIKGRELAWRNKRWDSIEHFNRVQRKWSVWAFGILIGFAVIGIVVGVAVAFFVRAHRA